MRRRNGTPGARRGRCNRPAMSRLLTDTLGSSWALEPVRKVLEDHHGFLAEAQRKAKNGRSHRLEETELSQLKEDVKRSLARATEARKTWLGARSKRSSNIQTFGARFCEFLTCYSGIVEVVKGADQQYGGIAYGTMSILFTVGRSSHSREEPGLTRSGGNQQTTPGRKNRRDIGEDAEPSSQDTVYH